MDKEQEKLRKILVSMINSYMVSIRYKTPEEVVKVYLPKIKKAFGKIYAEAQK